MLRYLTSGESHGKGLYVILEGLPAGWELGEEDINRALSRRQKGFGRGERMRKIEKDRVEISSGLRWGETLGSPLALVIPNKDWVNWRKLMSLEEKDINERAFVTRPRPGHADLAGGIKYGRKDLRDILERASARETAARVAVGAVCKKLLKEFNITIYSFTNEIGGIRSRPPEYKNEQALKSADKSLVRCLDSRAEKRIIKAIEKAAREGDSLGGVFTVLAKGVPVGLGNHIQWDRKLDGMLARALMSIQGIKGVEVGKGFEISRKKGSQTHDEILYSTSRGFYRRTNNAGGIEGGISNGEDIVLRSAMKPIPSLARPLKSVDIRTKQAFLAEVVRSDVCAVPAAGIVGEAVVAFEIARAMREKFGGDNLDEMKENFRAYRERVKKY